MRLTHEQKEHILRCTREIMGEDASVTVFGSRQDDNKHGGDLDLLIETGQHPSLLQRARLKLQLEQILNLPVDILACVRNASPTPFQSLAKARGTPLQ